MLFPHTSASFVIFIALYEYHSFFAFAKENLERRVFKMSMTLEILLTSGMLFLSTK